MATRKKPVKKVTDGMNWEELQAKLMDPAMTETELLKMIEAEKKGKKRSQFLLRIHGRYNVLRGNRERAALMK